MSLASRRQSGGSLKKANHEIGFVLTEGEMTFVTRKIYNVLISHAQRLGVEGKGVLPGRVDWDLSLLPEGAGVDQFFWMPMRDLVSDCATKRDYDLIRQLLINMKKISVTRRMPGVWERITSVIGDVAFLNTKAESGQERWLVGWQFPEGIEPFLLDPDKFTPISLYFQSVLSTEAALVLYEIGRRYASWDQHKTNEMGWKEWQSVLAGSRQPRDEYRLFKRDFLKPAIAEINNKTDIEINLVEIRDGKAISKLWFAVGFRDQQQYQLSLADEPAVNAKLYDGLVQAGLTPAVTEKLIGEFGEPRCQANLDYFSGQTGKNAGWLVVAIREDYAGAVAKKKPAVRSKKIDFSKASEIALGKESDESGNQLIEVKNQFDALQEPQKTTLQKEFVSTLATPMKKGARATFAKDWSCANAYGRLFLTWLKGRI